jgi:hypothetical protein
MFYIIIILAAIFAMPVKAFDGTPSPDNVTPRIFTAAPLDLPPDLMAQAPNLAAAAITPEKVLFPSTDADLKGGMPTTITGYLYKPAGPCPFAAVVSMPGCDGVLGESDDILGKKGEVHPLYGQLTTVSPNCLPRIVRSNNVS